MTLSLKHLENHCQAISWPIFDFVVSWGIRRPEKREGDGGTARGWSCPNTHID